MHKAALFLPSLDSLYMANLEVPTGNVYRGAKSAACRKGRRLSSNATNRLTHFEPNLENLKHKRANVYTVNPETMVAQVCP